MAAIHTPTGPLARCRFCGVQRQFHAKSDVPHSADRDHAFVAETIADFEPGDLSPPQLVGEIVGRGISQRALDCRNELEARLAKEFGVSWEELQEALA